MMLIDTHCHLDFKDFDKDRDDVVKRARAAGVKYIINVGSSIEGSERSLALSKEYDGVFASIGVHPHEAGSVTENTILRMRDMAKDKKVVAIGEVGLDYYRNNSPQDAQQASFRKFIKLASELHLPLIIHNREASADTIAILKEESGGGVKGVMHCFSGDENLLNKCLDIGLYISFTANVTFKNAGALRTVLEKVPLNRLFLETDAPFLAPQVFRGRRNEPSYLEHLVREIAGVKGVSEKETADITTENAIKFFGLDSV
ncbi:MAG: TatD family hydrolase [Candidatus Omnitrophica bacterium]|nr:TatD family hydrolase [Candidatus Omnitrophota bacterium]